MAWESPNLNFWVNYSFKSPEYIVQPLYVEGLVPVTQMVL